MAGYSPTPLVKKLGYKAGYVFFWHSAPDNYAELLGALPEATELLTELSPENLDFIHGFFTQKKELEKHFPDFKSALKKTGMLWISWPKGKSGIDTDLNRDLIREYGLSQGLVDVKVAAVDEQWSGLKFVYRTKDR